MTQTRLARWMTVFGFSLLCWTAIARATPKTEPTARPKLIVAIVFDQFRADYLMRFEKEFLPPFLKDGEVGGFRYLMTQGAYFPYGEYEVLQNMTGPGHSTILTGAYPYQSGISLNFWYDPDSQSPVYCTEDPLSPTIGAPTTNPHLGTSPKLMFANTVGDELKNAGYSSHVVSVALKDRAAILLGGHEADLALWFDPSSHQWVSSKYYLPDEKLPAWMVAFNDELKRSDGKKIAWVSTGKNSFDHTEVWGSRYWTGTPSASEMIGEAAERALDAFHLGQSKDTDLLAVSFSSHDYAGHHFGANSPEMESMTIAEDKILSHLLNHVRKKVPGGLSQVTFVLTGDHGVMPASKWKKVQRIETGRVDEEAVAKAISERLDRKFGKNPKSWVAFFADLVFFLDQKTIAERGLDRAAVEAEAKEVVLKTPGAFHVFTHSEYLARKLPPGVFERQALKGYFPGRSGDIVMIPRPYFTDLSKDTVSHLSGYAFDRTVPIILTGFGIQPGKYARQAHVVDIAPTLTYLAGTVPPSMSEGLVLTEAIRK